MAGPVFHQMPGEAVVDFPLMVKHVQGFLIFERYFGRNSYFTRR